MFLFQLIQGICSGRCYTIRGKNSYGSSIVPITEFFPTSLYIGFWLLLAFLSVLLILLVRI